MVRSNVVHTFASPRWPARPQVAEGAHSEHLVYKRVARQFILGEWRRELQPLLELKGALRGRTQRTPAPGALPLGATADPVSHRE